MPFQAHVLTLLGQKTPDQITCERSDLRCQAGVVRPSDLADVITQIVNDHPNSRIDELLPWAYLGEPALRHVA
jgi:hypothetical protein